MPTNEGCKHSLNFSHSCSALDGTSDVVPCDQHHTSKGPQIHEDHPQIGLEDGGVLVADANADGGHCRLAAVVDEESGKDVLYACACVASRDA